MLRAEKAAQDISIHPPRVGRDKLHRLRDAGDVYFNPPSPCGEGRRRRVAHSPDGNFNPPSPCGEGRTSTQKKPPSFIFQSTLPVWGGTAGGKHQKRRWSISIHPPRVGRDLSPRSWAGYPADFNPPSPCGEGPLQGLAPKNQKENFNPPSPCGEGQQKLTKILCKLLC